MEYISPTYPDPLASKAKTEHLRSSPFSYFDGDCPDWFWNSKPASSHWLEDLTDDQLDEVIQSVGPPRTEGIVPCGNPHCASCYPVAPDKQARSEIEANLNRFKPDEFRKGGREVTIEDSREDLQDQLDWAWDKIWQLTDELVTAEEQSDHWTQRAFLLEAAVRNYASQAWTDIKRALEEL
jgi:hypothetical protein